jgi:chemotaxis protein MotB
MSKLDDAPAEYIQIVVRRGHSEEEGHHGGVWKIAYADFMTAMMAFFLVMWLVNASNTEMKSSVASYFNPIKLSDNVIRKKGLRDVDGKANAEEESKSPKPKLPGEPSANPASQTLLKGEAVKLGTAENPGEALEPTDAPVGRGDNATGGGRAAETGRAFRDPFNPFAPGQLMSREGADKDSRAGAAPGTPGAAQDAPTLPAKPMVDPVKLAEAPRPNAFGDALAEVTSARRAGDQGPERRNGRSSEAGQQTTTGEAPADAAGGWTTTARKVEPDEVRSDPSKGAKTDGSHAKAGRPRSASTNEKAKLEAVASGVLSQIRKAVNTTAGDGGPGIDVRVEGSGIVLSLTDTSTFGMFAIGSSEPSRQTVDLINRIAPVIASNSKRIVVRGHTDSRVYRTEKSNNWRLSVSRAEAAYAMLVRSGLDEARFDRIEGYADRKLRDAASPEAATNRRIEILLQQVDE